MDNLKFGKVANDQQIQNEFQFRQLYLDGYILQNEKDFFCNI